MTIPVVRQRAHAPKTRTGCRTCRARHVKCDEQKPTCGRCNKSGRVCLGYDQIRQSNGEATTALQQRQAQPLSRPRSILQHVPRLHFDLTTAQKQSLDYFRLVTVHQLPGNPWLLSWEHLTLHANYQEPPILHAAVALGALHRAQTLSISGVDADLFDFAVEQCNRAMLSATQHIANITAESSDSAVEVVMVLSLLLFCFEVWCGQDIRASYHLRTGLSILWDRVQQRDGAASGDNTRRVLVRVEPKDNLDVLLQTFIRLDQDLTIQGKSDTRLVPVVSADLPKCFSSLENALVYLDSLAASIEQVSRDLQELAMLQVREELSGSERLDMDKILCLAAVRSRHMSLAQHPELASRLVTSKNDIAHWMRAFACVPFTSARESPHLLAQIQAFTLWHEVSYWRETNEMLEDRFDTQFEYILGLAERYVDLQSNGKRAKPVLSLGTALVHCIFGIAAKCRISSVRRRCIALIRSMNLQGVFDSHCVASFMETLVGLEESFARRILCIVDQRDFEAGQLPKAARLLESNMTDWETPEFYKGTHGRMVYAYHNSVGEVQVDYQPFTIARP